MKASQAIKKYRHLSLFLILGIVTRGISFFISPYIYSVLSEKDYILYDNITNYAAWFSIVGIGGYSTIVAKRFMDFNRPVIQSVITKIALRSLLIAAASVVLLWLIPNDFISISNFSLALLIVLLSVSFTIKKFTETVFRFNKDNGLYYASLLLPALFLFALVITGWHNLEFLLSCFALGYVASCLLILMLKFKNRSNDTTAGLEAIQSESGNRFYFMLASIILGATPLLERFILLDKVDSHFYLHYINTARILSLFGFLTQTIQLYAAPNIYQYISTRDYTTFVQKSRMSMGLLYVAYILLSVACIVLVPVLYPEHYDRSLLFQCALSSGFSLLLNYYIYSIYITIEYSDQYRRHIYMVIIALVIVYVALFLFRNVLLSLYLFPVAKGIIVYARYRYSDKEVKVYLKKITRIIALLTLLYSAFFACSVFC